MGIRPQRQAGFEGFESPQPEHALFFAILPTTSAARAAFALARDLKSTHSLRGEPMHLSRLHVTLQKLGEFAAAPPADLVARASEAAARIQVAAFELAFDEVLNLGNPADPVLALSGGTGKEVIEPLWDALRLSLARAGIKSPATPALPHMTLIYGSSALERQPVPSLCWPVNELVLVHSLLGQGKHRHLGRWRLNEQRSS